MAGELGSIKGSISIEYEGGGTKRAKDDVDDLENKARKTTGAIAGFFGGMAAGIVQAVSGMVVEVGTSMATGLGNAVLETEKSRDRLQAQLGEVDWAGKAGKAAGSLYRNAWGESLQEVNDAVRTVLQGGLLGGKATQKEIESITSRVIDLSDAFGQDVSQTVRAATQLVRTGLAKNGGDAIDILTVGFQKTGDLAGDLLDTFNEYGTQFRKLGIDGKQAVGLFTQGLAGGARDVDVVADALKEFSIRAVDGTELTAQGFKDIGLNADDMTKRIAKGGDSATKGLQQVLDALRDMEDPVKRDAAAVALFGTQSEDLGEALLALDPSSATESLGKVKGSAQELSDTLNQGAAVQLEAFKRQAREALVRRLAQAIPIIRAVFQALQQAFTFLDNNALPILKSVGKFISDFRIPIMIIGGLIATVFIPHWIALGVVATASAVKQATAWVIAQAGAVKAAAIHSVAVVRMIVGWTAMSVAAVRSGAQTVAIWALIQASSIRAIATQIAATATVVAGWVLMGAQALLAAAKIALAWLIALGPVGLLIAAIALIVGAIVWVATQTTWFQDIWKAIWNVIGGTVKTAFEFIKTVFLFYLNFLIAFWTAIWNGAVAVFKFVWNVIAAAIKLYIKIVTTVIKTALNVIRAVWSGAWNFARSLIEAVFKAVQRVVTRYINLWKTIITTALNVIKSAWSSAWNNVRSVVTAVINSIRSLIQTRIDQVKSIIRGVSAIVSTVRNAFDNARQAAVGRMNSLVSYVRGIPGRVRSALGNLAGRLFSAGQDIIRGLINGIKNMAGRAASAARDAVKGALDSAKGLLGIGSPSKVFRDEVGEMIPLGLAQGVRLTADVPQREVEKMLVSLTAAPSSSAVAARTLAATVRGGDGATYSFAPGSIVLDASKLKSIDDLVRMVDNLRPTARQFVRK